MMPGSLFYVGYKNQTTQRLRLALFLLLFIDLY
jgi:hypothetical protein